MQNSTSAAAEKNLSQVIKIDEAQIQQHLGEMVRSTVEETLNGLLDAEADPLCQARRYEHTDRRTDQRAGHYKRKLHTKAGEVELKVPKLRQAKFETAIIERYRRRESSVEEALMEMYLAGVSGRRVEGIAETLTYYAFPDKHQRQIRTNNPLERLMRGIRRRSRVLGCFPDGRSALMLAAAKLRCIAGTKWGTRRYRNMDRLKELKQERQEAMLASA
jgi:transposase-like protein